MRTLVGLLVAVFATQVHAHKHTKPARSAFTTTNLGSRYAPTPNAHLEIQARDREAVGLALLKAGRRDLAHELLGPLGSTYPSEISHLVTKLTLLGKPGEPTLRELARLHRGQWWGDEAKSGLKIIASPKRLAAFRQERRTREARGDNEYSYIARAVRMFRAGMSGPAYAMIRSVNRRPGPLHYAIELLATLGPKALPLLREIAARHRGTEWARQADEAIVRLMK